MPKLFVTVTFYTRTSLFQLFPNPSIHHPGGGHCPGANLPYGGRRCVHSGVAVHASVGSLR